MKFSSVLLASLIGCAAAFSPASPAYSPTAPVNGRDSVRGVAVVEPQRCYPAQVRLCTLSYTRFSLSQALYMVNGDGNSNGPLRIGTRGSPLALAQAYETRKRLQEQFEELREDGMIEICVLKTQGDMVLDKSLMELGGKGLFTKELDTALLGNEVDICVHSMKDVPTWLPEGTVLPCNLPREETNDAFIYKDGSVKRVEDLPDYSVIGTASLRRQAQLMAKNPTLRCVNFRGNVQTRLRKLDDGVVDATLLAIAGLKRMGMEGCATSVLDWDEMLPAVAQGAIGIQCRSDDERALKYINALNHMETHICVNCERAFLEALDGNCKTPIAGQARIVDGQIHFRGLIAMPDGSSKYEIESKGALEDAHAIGLKAGLELKERAGEKFFQMMVEMSPQQVLGQITK
jgi:hydroxymethylbilane synthase